MRQTSRQRLMPLILVLVIALLSIQSIGLLHAITHAGLSQKTGSAQSLTDGHTAQSDQSISAEQRLFDPRHSCASFDAATLAANLHSPAHAVLLALPLAGMPFWQSFLSRTTPFSCHFSSRAPPQL